jgi:hypothetical protein
MAYANDSDTALRFVYEIMTSQRRLQLQLQLQLQLRLGLGL